MIKIGHSEISEWIKDSVTNFHDIDETPPSYIFKIIKSLL